MPQPATSIQAPFLMAALFTSISKLGSVKGK